MNINITDILLGMLSNIPWWGFLFIPILFIFAYYQAKAEKYLKNKRYIDKKEAYKEHKKINKINSDKGNLYKTINNIEKKNHKSLKQKGDEYEAHVAKQYEEQGYKVVEHGKMHGIKDQGIDLMLKKGKEFLFVQCKDWDIKNKYRIDSKEIQYTRMNVRDYIEPKKELFAMYDWKILYITSDNILDKSAEHKIHEYSHEIEHKIIKV